MKCAIISVSQVGADLARMIGASLQADVDLYEKKEYASGAEAKYFTRVMALTTDIFTRYDLIIYIMALGITVRAIAPHVQHKTVDPAILGVDELGTFVISVLSGHLGGANDYAREVAEIIGATPVITTATDVHGKVAPDAIARHLQARVEPISALKTINGAIARGETVDYFKTAGRACTNCGSRSCRHYRSDRCKARVVASVFATADVGGRYGVPKRYSARDTCRRTMPSVRANWTQSVSACRDCFDNRERT